jgi:hypothetical protein
MVARSPMTRRYNPPVVRSVLVWAVLTALAGFGSLGAGARGQRPSPVQADRPGAAVTASVAVISYSEAKPILERLAASLPAELAGKPSELQSAWREWVSRRNLEIRARLERGDEDSIVNFLLFGTTYRRQ